MGGADRKQPIMRPVDGRVEGRLHRRGGRPSERRFRRFLLRDLRLDESHPDEDVLSQSLGQEIVCLLSEVRWCLAVTRNSDEDVDFRFVSQQ